VDVMDNFWWNLALFYIKTFLSGNLRFCDNCGELTECYRFGDSVRDHYKAFKQLDPSFEIPDFKSEHEAKMLCMFCNMEFDALEGVHRNCCYKVADEITKDAEIDIDEM
jgi:hypothetical protein